jgi:hypothetical protein
LRCFSEQVDDNFSVLDMYFQEIEKDKATDADEMTMIWMLTHRINSDKDRDEMKI